jgi:hypothetical protein
MKEHSLGENFFCLGQLRVRCRSIYCLVLLRTDAVALAACDSGAISAGQKEPGFRPECPASCFTHRAGANCVRRQYFLPLSRVYTRRGIPGSPTGQCCRCIRDGAVSAAPSRSWSALSARTRPTHLVPNFVRDVPAILVFWRASSRTDPTWWGE